MLANGHPKGFHLLSTQLKLCATCKQQKQKHLICLSTGHKNQDWALKKVLNWMLSVFACSLLLTFICYSLLYLRAHLFLSPLPLWLFWLSLLSTETAFCIRCHQAVAPGGHINSVVRTMAQSCQLPSASIWGRKSQGVRARGLILFRKEQWRGRNTKTKHRVVFKALGK